MRIIAPRNFVTMPWKNGGGVTHEILKHESEGGMLWRLSMAEVKSDGPFSLFEGMTRILTVIEGDGLDLSAQGEIIEALPFLPVRFSGDTPITSMRRFSDVIDFNVIFDGKQIDASVVVLPPGENLLQRNTGAMVNAVFTCGPLQVNGQLLAARSFCQSTGDELECQGSDSILHVLITSRVDILTA